MAGDDFATYFDNQWLTPRELVDDLESSYEYPHSYILKRLQLGIIKAVARAGPSPDHGVSPFVPVPSQLWPNLVEHQEFWDSGDATFSVGSVTGYGDGVHLLFIGIRFDPTSITSNAPEYIDYSDARSGVPTPPQPTVQITPNSGAAPAVISKPKASVSSPNLDKAAKLIADLWGIAITEDRAWQIAKACFPDNQVAKHRFLDQYRIYRPAKKRGKQPGIDI